MCSQHQPPLDITRPGNSISGHLRRLLLGSRPRSPPSDNSSSPGCWTRSSLGRKLLWPSPRELFWCIPVWRTGLSKEHKYLHILCYLDTPRHDSDRVVVVAVLVNQTTPGVTLGIVKTKTQNCKHWLPSCEGQRVSYERRPATVSNFETSSRVTKIIDICCKLLHCRWNLCRHGW